MMTERRNKGIEFRTGPTASIQSVVAKTKPVRTPKRRRVGRPRKRGLKKKTHGARVSGAKRTKVGKELKRRGVPLEVSTEGMTVTLPRTSGIRLSGANIQKETLVISLRARSMAKGITDPFQQPPKDMPQSVQDYFLGSRAIRNMAYDPDKFILEIIFQTGWGYQFMGVPHAVWIAFKAAPSKGQFFMNEIYGYWSGKPGSKIYHPNYSYRRVK